MGSERGKACRLILKARGVRSTPTALRSAQRPGGHKASVNRNRGAGDVIRLFGNQERDKRGDLLRLTVPLQSDIRTVMPSSARRSAIAAPMPIAAPVTRATFASLADDMAFSSRLWGRLRSRRPQMTRRGAAPGAAANPRPKNARAHKEPSSPSVSIWKIRAVSGLFLRRGRRSRPPL